MRVEIEAAAKRYGHAVIRRNLDGGPRTYLGFYSVVNEPHLLALLRKICYETQDVRAGWFGAGIPRTDLTEYKPLAEWATAHWSMYSGFLSNAGEVTESVRLLDVGCGTGHASVCLASIYPQHRITALDVDICAIDFAKAFNAADNIEYLCQDFLAPAFRPREPYRFIFALEVLEHLPAARHYAFVDKCLALLEDGGLLFMTTPNALDEVDSTYGHVGMLNRERVPPFFQRYRRRLVETSFYDNRSLAAGDPDKFIIRESYEMHAAPGRNRSHFRLVMR